MRISIAPACKRNLSASVDLPWSMCAIIEKFLINCLSKLRRHCEPPKLRGRSNLLYTHFLLDKYYTINVYLCLRLVGGFPAFLLIYSVLSGPYKLPVSFSFITLNPSLEYNFSLFSNILKSALLLNSISLAFLKNSICFLLPVNLLPKT